MKEMPFTIHYMEVNPNLVVPFEVLLPIDSETMMNMIETVEKSCTLRYLDCTSHPISPSSSGSEFNVNFIW